MDISAVNAHINIALASLHVMKDAPGSYPGELVSNLTSSSAASIKGVALLEASDVHKAAFVSVRGAYLDSLTENLEERLCSDSNYVLHAFNVLEPSMAVFLSDDERNKFLMSYTPISR
jgi:hypothetical protein